MLRTLIIAILYNIFLLNAAIAEKLDNGLHTQSWLNTITDGDIMNTLEEALRSVVKFMLRIEQPGCYYCVYEHRKVFTDPALKKILEDNVVGAQMMIAGQFPISDGTGELTTEEVITERWGVNFTPTTFVVLPNNTKVKSESLHISADVMIPGAIEVQDYLRLFSNILSE